MDYIDNFLNRITMYRLVLYSLIILAGAGAVFGAIRILPYGFFPIVFSSFFLAAACQAANIALAKIFRVPANVESAYITALILALIMAPVHTAGGYIILFWVSVLAMAGKFILAINKKHIFNPAALAAVISSFALGQSASWWVGTAVMLPLVLIAGLLIVRKIQRADLVFAFLATALVLSIASGVMQGGDAVTLAKELLVDSPLFFLAFIMLTEPLTTPPTQSLQIWYGIIVGILFTPGLHIADFYFSPELALVVGNIFSYAVSPKRKFMLELKSKSQIARDTYNFVFKGADGFKFAPGQYMEWTLGHKNPDSRGNRRYFTVASSPTEDEVSMGIKFYSPSSTFKKSLLALDPGQGILAGQLSGDFTLPKNQTQKLLFIAGGIGITPFRSMIKYLMDKNEKRDIVMFYANRTYEDVAYADILDQAQKQLGIKVIYTLSSGPPPAGWTGQTGYVNEQMIKTFAPDYQSRLFYISGPRSMTTGFEQALGNMGIHNSQIKLDFFPGFA